MPLIRSACAADAAAICALHEAAFPTDAEARLVGELARDGDVLCSLVAEDKDQILGHILFSRMTVEADRRPLRAAGVGPIGVLRDQRQRGIGGMLMRAGVEEMRRTGSDILFLVGDPAYYARFGFAAETAEAFASPYAGPFFMALVLRDPWAAPVSGRAEYAPAFAMLETHA